MRFIIDAQLPAGLARALTDLGYPSVAVRDIGLRESEDETIWAYATDHKMIIITKDEDFADRVLRTPSGPAIVWLRLGNCSNRTLCERLLPLMPDIIDRINQGDRLIEVS